MRLGRAEGVHAVPERACVGAMTGWHAHEQPCCARSESPGLRSCRSLEGGSPCAGARAGVPDGRRERHLHTGARRLRAGHRLWRHPGRRVPREGGRPRGGRPEAAEPGLIRQLSQCPGVYLACLPVTCDMACIALGAHVGVGFWQGSTTVLILLRPSATPPLTVSRQLRSHYTSTGAIPACCVLGTCHGAPSTAAKTSACTPQAPLPDWLGACASSECTRATRLCCTDRDSWRRQAVHDCRQHQNKTLRYLVRCQRDSFIAVSHHTFACMRSTHAQSPGAFALRHHEAALLQEGTFSPIGQDRNSPARLPPPVIVIPCFLVPILLRPALGCRATLAPSADLLGQHWLCKVRGLQRLTGRLCCDARVP